MHEPRAEPMEIVESRAQLERTPAVFDALFAGASREAVVTPYAEGSFSAYNVLGHLIIGEKEDWIPRTRIILEHADAEPFPPFDWTAKIDPDAGPPVDELLAEFADLRAENLRTLNGLAITDSQLDLKGAHPVFGTVTLREMLSVWAVHDLHHIAQACKGLACHFKPRVGPWAPGTGILQPPER